MRFHQNPIYKKFLQLKTTDNHLHGNHRLPYQIVLLHRGSDTSYIENLIREESALVGNVTEISTSETPALRNLFRIGIHLSCLRSERSLLVRIVSRLGMEASVCSVWWESEPVKLYA